MKKTVVAILLVGTSFLISNQVEAHHTTITCQSPGTWNIENSESDKSMTYTTDQGHSGSIGPGDTVSITYSGTSLTVFGTWDNGATNTNSGEGNCEIIQSMTTTIPISISTTSSLVSTTSEPGTTTSTVQTQNSSSTSVTLPQQQDESSTSFSTIKETTTTYTKPVEVVLPETL